VGARYNVQLCVQEFCNGGSLRAALRRGVFAVGGLPRRWDALSACLRAVAEAMEHMHAERICHGDLTPAHVLFTVRALDPSPTSRCLVMQSVCSDPAARALCLCSILASRNRSRVVWPQARRSSCASVRAAVRRVQYDASEHRSVRSALRRGAAVPKVSDFGAAMRVAQNASHASGAATGSPFYVAPETAASARLHQVSDVYAYGVIMWELMMGCLVYVPKCAPQLPPPARQMLGACCPCELR
jgi:serine/threonine protein kinase